MKRRVNIVDVEGHTQGRQFGPMRPGKTMRDKRSGAWARRLANRAARGRK